jgi:hypothetical protein
MFSRFVYWLLSITREKTPAGYSEESTSMITHPNDRCFNCGREGKQTSLINGRSYCCRRCNVWWINPAPSQS